VYHFPFKNIGFADKFGGKAFKKRYEFCKNLKSLAQVTVFKTSRRLVWLANAV